MWVLGYWCLLNIDRYCKDIHPSPHTYKRALYKQKVRDIWQQSFGIKHAVNIGRRTDRALQAFCIFNRCLDNRSKIYLFLLTVCVTFYISTGPVVCQVIFVSNFRELALPFRILRILIKAWYLGKGNRIEVMEFDFYIKRDVEVIMN